MLSYVLTVWLLLFLGQDLVVLVFSARGITADLVRLFCNVAAGGFLFVGCLFVANSAFNNLGFPLLSTAFNWGRATLGTLPFVTLGAWLWRAEGVLYGQMAGALVFGLAALLTAFRVVRRLGDDRDRAEQPDWNAPAPTPSSGKAALATVVASPAQTPDR
jgi:Na+-driven multidrug efflux pump